MADGDWVEKVVLKRVDTYGPKPRSGVEVLRQARALLQEEGRWRQSYMFEDGDPKEVFENGSLCGNWGVCLMGAIGVVTGTMTVAVGRLEQENHIAERWLDEACQHLTTQGLEEWAEGKGLSLSDYTYSWVVEANEEDVAKDAAAFKAIQKLAAAIGKHSDPVDAVVCLNDRSGTTRESVLQLLDKAIGEK